MKNTIPTNPEIYINQPQVQKAIQSLKTEFGDDFSRLMVSDTLDEHGHQYVNLVQKGGGVLGIALVGYTYILELAGIRFLRLAGTSAGAINTAMCTVIGEKQEPKSEKILEYLSKMDFFSFVDGHPFAKWIIRNFVTNKKFEKQAKSWILNLLITLGILSIIAISALGLRYYYSWADPAGLAAFLLIALILLTVAVSVIYLLLMVSKLRSSGYGINPGDEFLNWMKNIMEENGVTDIDSLNKKASAKPKLLLREDNSSSADSLCGDVTFITSELVTQNKIQFPLMNDLFCSKPNGLHPAEFVRASMSIPIFFESYIISGVDGTDPLIRAAWEKHFKIETDKYIPATYRFVDGGMLSNFPINVFYNPSILEPRLPVFGIDLDDTDPSLKPIDNVNWSLMAYIWKLFNTVRYYYDKDFLEKNRVFGKGIGSVKLFKYNWLNFFLTEEEKMEMFALGAEAAAKFLINFNWREYRQMRTDMQTNFNEQNSANPPKKSPL